MKGSGVSRGVGRVVLVALAAVIVMVACGLDDEAAVPGVVGWEPISIDGKVQGLGALGTEAGDIYAAGDDDGRPFVVSVVDGDAVPIRGDWTGVEGTMGFAELSTDGGMFAMATRVDPVAGPVPETWWFSVDGVYEHEALDGGRVEAAPDDDGHLPVFLAPLTDGEGDARTVGVVKGDDGSWLVRVWNLDGYEEYRNDDPALRLGGMPTPGDLLVANTEATVYVAGDLTADPDDDSHHPRLWWIEGYDAEQGWEEIPLDPVPAGLTDAQYWELGFWLAGHLDGQPIVYDFDEATEPTLAVPDTDLDPARPTVLIARTPLHDPMVLATQSIEGPTLWVDGPSGFERIPGPPGALQDATVSGPLAYLLVDGQLWVRDLSAD